VPLLRPRSPQSRGKRRGTSPRARSQSAVARELPEAPMASSLATMIVLLPRAYRDVPMMVQATRSFCRLPAGRAYHRGDVFSRASGGSQPLVLIYIAIYTEHVWRDASREPLSVKPRHGSPTTAVGLRVGRRTMRRLGGRAGQDFDKLANEFGQWWRQLCRGRLCGRRSYRVDQGFEGSGGGRPQAVGQGMDVIHRSIARRQFRRRLIAREHVAVRRRPPWPGRPAG
jgi:hypothetical protein